MHLPLIDVRERPCGPKPPNGVGPPSGVIKSTREGGEAVMKTTSPLAVVDKAAIACEEDTTRPFPNPKALLVGKPMR